MAKTLGVTFAIGAKVNPTVASAFATVEQKIRASQGKMRELTEKAKVLATAEAAKQRVMVTQKIVAASGGRDPIAREVLARELEAFQKAAAAAKKYGVAIADIGRAHAQTNRELAQTEKRLQALNRAQAYREKRQEAASSLKAAAVPALALTAPIAEAIKFESAMASAAKTIDGMRDDSGKLTAQYHEMEAAIKQMGQTLPLTHDELAKLFAAGGQQGMTAVSDLREFTTMAAQMAVAFDMSTEQAADAIGGYRSALNLTMPEARSLLDLMNQYANTTSASEKGIADVVRRVGSLGAVGGIAAKPVTALAATLDAMKVAPEVAATGIKNLILAMTAGTAATKSQKAAFASLGIDTVKLAKQMQTDGPAAIISVLEAVQKLPKASQLSTMQQIFGKESLGSIAPLLANLDKVKENLITCGDESAYAGAMQKEFDNVSGTTANKLILLKNRLQEVGITVAGALLPAIQKTTETIGPPISAVAKFAGEHKNLTTAAIGVAASLVGLKVGAAAVMWCVSGFSGAFNLAKAAISGFSAVTRIAAGVQTAFNAAMALNPVGIVVIAVGALAAGLVYLYNTCEPVRAAFDSAFSWIGEKVKTVAAFVEGMFSKVLAGMDKVK
ncbi:MAG: phage tail tape measure protein, partial [Desulfovibrio sp.]|nr:phage tail tape measure protein [Desulfovibrio sp.]